MKSVEHSCSSLDETCFCDKPRGSVLLHDDSSFDLDRRVREYALKLENKPVLAKLSAGDLLVQEAKYQVQCFTPCTIKQDIPRYQETIIVDVTVCANFIDVSKATQQVQCCGWLCHQLFSLFETLHISCFTVQGCQTLNMIFSLLSNP